MVSQSITVASCDLFHLLMWFKAESIYKSNTKMTEAIETSKNGENKHNVQGVWKARLEERSRMTFSKPTKIGNQLFKLNIRILLQ